MNFEGFGAMTAVGLVPADDAIVLRQSGVGSMDLCPARQGYLLSGRVKQVPSEAMSFGTMIHTFAELRIGGWDGIVTLQLLKQWWDEAVAKDGAVLDELIGEEKLASSLQEALEACATWDNEIWPMVKSIKDPLVEEQMVAPLGVTPSGREVWLRGTPDLVDLECRQILDWKTAGRGWDQSKADLTHQAAAYSFLVEDSHGVLIFDFAYVVWDRKKRQWSVLETRRSREQVDAWLRHAWQRALQIEAGAFPFTPIDSTFGKFKRGWWCSAKYCAAWDVCEGKYLHDDVWEEQTISVRATWA